MAYNMIYSDAIAIAYPRNNTMVTQTKISIYKRLRSARNAAKTGSAEYETLCNATARCVSQILDGRSADDGITLARSALQRAMMALQRACGDVIADVPLVCRRPWLLANDPMHKHVDEARLCLVEALQSSVVVRRVCPDVMLRGLTRGNPGRAAQQALPVLSEVGNLAECVWKLLDERVVDALIDNDDAIAAFTTNGVDKSLIDLRMIVDEIMVELGAYGAKGGDEEEDELWRTGLSSVSLSLKNGSMDKLEEKVSNDKVERQTSMKQRIVRQTKLGVKQRLGLWQRNRRCSLLGMQ